MEVLKVIGAALAMVLLAVAALSVRLLFVKDGKFSGGSCRSTQELSDRGIGCGCGSEQPCTGNNHPEE